MPKLTDTQLIVLSKAAARDDGAAVVPDRLDARRIDWTYLPNRAVVWVRARHEAPAPPAKGHCGVVLVTADAVEARGKMSWRDSRIHS